jgi:hypothetical protein
MTTTYVNPSGQLLPPHCQRTSGVTFHGHYRSGTYVIEGSCLGSPGMVDGVAPRSVHH